MIYQKHNSVGNYYFEAIVYDNFNFVLHLHKHPELIYVLDGEVEIEVENGIETAKQGDFALILGDQAHAYNTKNHSKVWVGVFSGDWVGKFNSMVNNRRGLTSIFRCDPDTTKFLVDNLINKSGQSVLELKAYLYAVCAEYEKKVQFVEQKQQGKDLLHKILEYISERYKEPITLKHIAKDLGYEQHYLSRCFHNSIKMNFRQFVNQYRVDCAKDMLLNGEQSISTIALESGFQSIRTFNRVFKGLTGTQPRSYRKS